MDVIQLRPVVGLVVKVYRATKQAETALSSLIVFTLICFAHALNET